MAQPVKLKFLANRGQGKTHAVLTSKEVKNAVELLAKNAIKPKNGSYDMSQILNKDHGLCQGCGTARAVHLCYHCGLPVCPFCEMRSFILVDVPGIPKDLKGLEFWWMICRDCFLKEFWTLMFKRVMVEILDVKVLGEVKAHKKKLEKEEQAERVAMEATARLKKIYPYLRQ